MTQPTTGHIKLARKAFASDGGDPLWLERREFSRWEAWVDVIQLAAWKPWRFVTRFGPIDLQRGEFVASLRYLADRWTWTVKKVRTWLDMLCGEKWARLRAQQETQAGTVYLIVNYERYQATDPEPGTQKGTPEGTAGAQQGHKREAVKAVKQDGETNIPRKSRRAPALALVEHSWPAEGAATWLELVGRMAPGRFGKALKDLVDRDGWPAVRVTLIRWIVERQAAGKPLKVEWFADEYTQFSKTVAQPIVDEFGVLTEFGERLTRPVKHA